MSQDLKALFDERLGRYQGAIALEPTDRIPVATGSNYFAEVYSGNTNQQTIYDTDKWLEAEIAFCRDFPEVDVLRNNRVYGPLYDAVGVKTYKLPGRDLPARSQFQFVEQEYMLADEYDEFLRGPVDYLFAKWLPRVLGELGDKGSPRAYIAFLKAGMAQANFGMAMRNRGMRLQNECGMPQPMAGFFLAPFDALGDAMRGLTGVLMDCFRQPDKVVAACDLLVSEMANLALATADPLKRWPIFVPTHKPMFLDPAQFDKFYWPSFKKVCEILIEAGHTVRAYLEGNWSAHWHHMLELPKGKVLCDIDNQADIVRAKKDIGYHQCIAGGIQDSSFIVGTPQEMRDSVRRLCDEVGPGGGFMLSGGCNFPYTSKPENVRALVEAALEFGVYDKGIKAKPRPADPSPPKVTAFSYPKMVTPWEVKKSELGEILGDEGLIRRPWEQLEAQAYTWIWQWVL